MLNFLHIDPKFDRSSLFDEAKESTWLVADLEHKRWLQDSFFENESWLSEDRILRANELWLKILVRQFPELNIVSPMFLDSFIRQWLPKQNISWAQGESSAGILKDYLEFFLPVLVKEDSYDLVRCWLKENQSAFLRWGNWFELSIILWAELRSHKFVLAKWAPAYLLAESDNLQWEQDLIIDLGPDLSIVEAQLVQALAKSLSAKILVPKETWRQEYPRALWPYQYLLDEASQSKSISRDTIFPDSIECKRYVTQLAEVRACVSQIRKWLDSGVSKKDISIVAVDPEEYWPVLSAYLEKEAIPVAKPQICVAHSIPAMSRWLSQLRVRSRPLSSEDYEAELFSKMTQPEMSYEKFRGLLSNIYSEEDLVRLGGLKKQFESQISPSDEISRDEFISWAIQFWDLKSDPESLRQVMSTILLESPAQLKLDLLSWNSYVQAVTGKTEIQVVEAHDDGVRIRKLSSVFFSQEDYQFFIGHSDRSLDESLRISVSIADVVALGQDLGYLLARPEPGKGQMLTDWALKSKKSASILSFSQSSFSGEAQGASLLWLQLAKSKSYPEEVESNFSCRWDEIQEQNFESLSVPYGDKSVVLQDLGEAPFQALILDNIPPLSASKLEAYMDCPFKYTASRIFGLQSLPEVDLDLDRMRRGSLLHKCFEIILERGFNVDLTAVIREARLAEGIYVPEKLWPLQIKSTLKILKKFIEFETVWRKEFPQTRTVGRELDFSGEWQGHKFSGKIDRVDTNDSNQYVLIDYKSSGSSLTNYGRWLKNHNIQLLVYTMAIQNSWTELPPGDVVGAFFFNIKDWDRNKGFCIKDSGAELYPEEKKKQNLLDETGLSNLMGGLDELMQKQVELIGEGRLWPEPEDPKKTCESCDWRTLCRAPHLN